MMQVSRYGALLMMGGAAIVANVVSVGHAVALSPAEISQTAKKVTVLIEGQNPGSGVIINRDGNTYTVLTAHHVVGTPDEYDIVTSRDQTYRLNYQSVKKLAGTDLATLTFQSQSNYSVASLGSSSSLLEGANIYVTGFPAPSEAINLSIFSFTEGRLIANSSKLLADGYSLVYSNSTQPGMSGGPVFNEQGKLIGVHGRADALLQDGVYFKQNKNLGIAIDTFLSLAKKQNIRLNQSSTAPQDPNSSNPSMPAALVSQPPVQQPQAQPLQNRASDFYLSALDKNIRGDSTGALRDLDQAIRINPNFADAYADRASVKGANNDFRGAIADLDQALRINPDLGIAYAYRGVYQAALGDQRGANADVNLALQKSPDVGYTARAIVRWLDNRFQEALADFNAALLQPSESNRTAEMYYGRGILHWQLGNKPAALADVNRSLQIQPEYAQSLEMRGLLHMSNGQIDAALRDLQTALQLNPNLTSTYEVRSVARLLNRDFLGAAQDAAKLRHLDPKIDSYGVMGIAQVQLGNLPRAVQEFRLGAQRIPESRENYTQLAQELSQIPPDNPFLVSTVQVTIQSYLESFLGSFIEGLVQSYRPIGQG